MRPPLVAVAFLAALAAGPAGAYHAEDGSYRCDGGFCEDGREHIIDCGGAACTGDRGGFTTIVRPKFGEGAWLRDDDFVIGVAIGGDVRAYPVRIISGQQGWEMVTDTVGGTPIVVTYCPLCASAIVYGTVVDGRALTFRNTGAIWKWDLVMYDKETESLWTQVGGHGIHGAFEDAELPLVGSEMVRWEDWRAARPATRAMEIPRDASGNAMCSCPPVPLSPDRLVHGVVVEGETIAFPLAILAEEGVAQLSVGDADVVAAYRGDNVHVFHAGGATFHRTGDERWMVSDDGLRYDTLTGQAEDGSHALGKVPGKTTFSHRWESFHPGTLWYEGGSGASDGRGPAQQDERAPVPATVATVALALALAFALARSGRFHRKGPLQP